MSEPSEPTDPPETSSSARKRMPGRPRKNPIRQPRPRRGLVEHPTNAQNYIEFLYDKPLIFKKILQLLKAMAIKKVYFLFSKTSITIWCEDHWGNKNIRIKINCDEVNQYYCHGELDVCILSRNLELIMATIDKSCNSILILSTQDNAQKNLQIILKNDIGTDTSYKIELLGDIFKPPRPDSNESKFDVLDHMINITLPSRYFKKTISDIRTFSDQITLKQDSDADPLMFEYSKTDKKVKSYMIIPNNDCIEINSNLAPGNWFSTSFMIEAVKPISSALLAENIKIYADEAKPLMFAYRMDNNTIELKAMINIVKETKTIT